MWPDCRGARGGRHRAISTYEACSPQAAHSVGAPLRLASSVKHRARDGQSQRSAFLADRCSQVPVSFFRFLITKKDTGTCEHRSARKSERPVFVCALPGASCNFSSGSRGGVKQRFTPSCARGMSIGSCTPSSVDARRLCLGYRWRWVSLRRSR